MKKINIDEYYLVRIFKIVSSKQINQDSYICYDKFEKWAIINMKEKEHFFGDLVTDTLSGEQYYLNTEHFEGINQMFVEQSRFIPLNQVVNKDTNYMKKKEFLKLCRNFIIDLNSKNLSEGQKDVIGTIQTKEKENKFVKRRSKK